MKLTATIEFDITDEIDGPEEWESEFREGLQYCVDNDVLDKTQSIDGYTIKDLTWAKTYPKKLTNSQLEGIKETELWLNDRIQFARLIDELQAAGAFTDDVFSDLETSMDLDYSDIREIIERAIQAFDRAKEGL